MRLVSIQQCCWSDPDPVFHFDADPDPILTFDFDADPDPASLTQIRIRLPKKMLIRIRNTVIQSIFFPTVLWIRIRIGSTRAKMARKVEKSS